MKLCFTRKRAHSRRAKTPHGPGQEHHGSSYIDGTEGPDGEAKSPDVHKETPVGKGVPEEATTVPPVETLSRLPIERLLPLPSDPVDTPSLYAPHLARREEAGPDYRALRPSVWPCPTCRHLTNSGYAYPPAISHPPPPCGYQCQGAGSSNQSTYPMTTWDAPVVVFYPVYVVQYCGMVSYDAIGGQGNSLSAWPAYRPRRWG